ncbi:bifunctional glutamate N-acetyltransferase/amino-acid acetyltransferase ArgJ [Carnobacterium gallinarum]|uniref:bifunctional glutamate N-acetyltransferase/amino-acid acetyltransferase ArgJ n=1 Tax=Carnobacterium gallinarum TaxID=2749 RepID=UPI00054D3506|nr:bifunctional glutamate N-acetyltransferase/amino-acid acetyltransferase ArgJ [Carnobacterium gallinarum]
MRFITGTIASPKGFFATGVHGKLKYKRKDIGLIYSEVPAVAAAVYTTNQFQAAPIIVTKDSLNQSKTLQAVIVNSGNANACNGENGLKDAYTMRQLTAAKLGIDARAVAVASTGIIGEPLPMEKIINGIKELDFQKGVPLDFHESILTTDTCEKQITVELILNQHPVIISGVAKGSGMIHPNMATMLAFITTDVAISSKLLDQLLRQSVNQTFNQITVDGDTSTNDTVLVMANGLAGNSEISEENEDYQILKQAFEIVCEHLAKKIAQDGEGATKLIEVTVDSAKNIEEARMIAKTIVSSSLVKTAMFGEDPNWGRIICATGYSQGSLDPANIRIEIGSILILKNTKKVVFEEAALKEYLENDVIRITVDVGVGTETGVAWGCDLSYDYVKINACYHT